MKIAIIADTHFGCRKNSPYFMHQQKIFFKDKFFPYLKENGITTVIHLGDFFDNRKTVNFDTLRHAKDVFINPIIEHNMNLHMIVGNHDSYYKSNGDLTSTKLLFDGIEGINVYDTATELSFGGKTFFFVPWIFPIQKEEMVDRLRVANYNVICGHFEMVGVVYQGSTISRKGIDTDTFSHIKHVFSGHYHKKSQYYVGSPYQMTWSDYGDSKRIVVYDTEKDSTEDVYLADDIYVKIDYPYDFSSDHCRLFHDKIVRVTVKSKDNPAEFESCIDYIEECLPHKIDVKEEYLYIDILDEDDLDDDTDTLGILLSSIDDISDLSKGDQVVIKEILKKLYEKAGEK